MAFVINVSLVLQCVPLLVVDVRVLDHREKVLQLHASTMLVQRNAADVVVLPEVLVPHSQLDCLAKQLLQVYINELELLFLNQKILVMLAF